MPEKEFKGKKLSNSKSLEGQFLIDVKMQNSCHLILSKIRKNTCQVFLQLRRKK